ncbi:hypothetical protein DFP72DRAFT_509002 [Ephemerocybe angulata]|uniref:Uncharacterized protein n=1 Tax=Ephemerocybe angulata TaxID=980116 RepID=A0A8H6M3D8_9AGAR|nr:hypothetical protein DFP72DRAFT_509002 [Tulosesus angulatus]
MSFARPDFWIPRITSYAFAVVDLGRVDSDVRQMPDSLDYVTSIFVVVGLLVVQCFLLTKLTARGRRWYLSKKKESGGPSLTTRDKRILSAVAASSALGALTILTCILLCANFMMRTWAVGFVTPGNEVVYDGSPDGPMIDCWMGLKDHCISLGIQFSKNVERLEITTAFMMQLLMLISAGLLVHRGGLLKPKTWFHVLPALPFLVLIGSTIAGMWAVYYVPTDYPARPGKWFSYHYHGSDPHMRKQIDVAEITPTISTAALVFLNLIFTVSVLVGKGFVRACTLSMVVESSLPSLVVGLSLFFIPVYRQVGGTFFYMRMARYTLRTMWAALLIVTPQIIFLEEIRVRDHAGQPAEESTVIENEGKSFDIDRKVTLNEV